MTSHHVTFHVTSVTYLFIIQEKEKEKEKIKKISRKIKEKY